MKQTGTPRAASVPRSEGQCLDEDKVGEQPRLTDAARERFAIDCVDKLKQLCAPDWDDGRKTEEKNTDPSPMARSFPHPATSLLEAFSDDVSGLILSHLDLQEIANVSLVSQRLYKSCRSNTLWKTLMAFRWNILLPDNVDEQQPPEKNHFAAYQRAHAHPHDLWISHWNIVFPHDGLAPGRCFLREVDDANDCRKHCGEKHCADGSASSNPLSCCPHCRKWNDLVDPERNASESDTCCNKPWIQPSTPAQLVALATTCTRQRCSSPPEKLANEESYVPKSKARQAFSCAGTFGRKLKVRQYQGGPSDFLTDLLFFNLSDPMTEAGQWELDQLLREAQETQQAEEEEAQTSSRTTTPTDLSLYETSHHSWHICRLFNPDFYRPILYQIGVQRPDCFTVYPSEGFIEPGGTMYLTIGVRPFGSALAYAFDALNVQRDGLNVAWADLYTEQAHLPMAPILVRYHFATAAAMSADPTNDPRRRPPTSYDTKVPKSRKDALLEYHWRQPIAAHQVRSIHLSAHVHSYYCFPYFLKATCCPWNLKRNYRGLLFVAPVLHEEYPEMYQKLQDVPVCGRSLLMSLTEGPCLDCGESWSVREEELAQAFFVCQAEIDVFLERRTVLLDNVARCIRMFIRGCTGKPSKHSILLTTICRALQCLKASPWTSLKQKRIVLQLEAIVDDVYRQIAIGGENWIPWRLAGVYRYATCTDSVFKGPLLEDGVIGADFKDEPDYLDAFRHLTHSPGRYCLGPQEDPNHLEETVVTTSPRYGRKQKGIVTDVFMDDPISAFQAGICMMRDARSLLVHGIYDRIPYPGSVVRCPKQQVAKPLTPRTRRCVCVPAHLEDQLLQWMEKRRVFAVLQNGLDLDAIYGAYRSTIGQISTHTMDSSSLDTYLRGIPPPGVGRFPLSQESRATDIATGPSRILPLGLEENSELPESASDGDDNSTGIRQNVTHHVHPHRPPFAGNMRGPRLMHLLWVLGAQLGLAVIDSPDIASVYVDRTILIASQWVSISLMAAPLFWTLCARYAQLIPSQPVDYNLEDLPFSISNKLRFLTDRECGFVAVLVLFVWLGLGRWTERMVSRDFFRVMLEHITPQQEEGGKVLFVRRLVARLLLWFQRQWDMFCPLFLQRRVFAPQWNRRTRDDLMKHIAFWRSRNLSQALVARTAAARREHLFGDCRDEGIDLGRTGSTAKVLVGAFVALGSFCSSSPHFWLNLVTVFSCSISLGMSVSLHCMEKGRSSVNFSSTGAMIKAASLATVVILAFLVGQLVGSSGGTMFLAEFIVTSISLILGGAGTISASAMESWGCFFCLSTTAFWGYLFGRVALMDGIRQKRGGYSSILLSKAVIFLFFFWVLVFMVSRWDSPVTLMIVRVGPSTPKELRVPVAKLLQ